jgi:protein gp37
MTVRRSKIGYADYSGGDANFAIGCTPISEGCANCYARALYARWGKEAIFSTVQFYPEKLARLGRTLFEPGDQPFRRGPDSNPLVFVVDLGDLFHRQVTDEQIRQAALVFTRRPDVDWLILTKRADRLQAWTATHLPQGWPPNVWPGVTVENMSAARRIPYLQATRAQGVRWLSVEPMLESLPLPDGSLDGIGWVVCGAESGPKRRPFAVWWAQDLYGKCEVNGVPFFGKQDSDLYPGRPLWLGGREVKQWPA